MAGSIGLSLTQRFDKTSHEPLDGGLVYFYAAGTTTPQSAYQDISLTIPWPNPITLDSGGNVGQLFFADGYIKFRITNSAGVTQTDADYVLVLGPSSGGGAAPSVDATTILATGDIKTRYGTDVLTGFVRANGRTIGSATSGASERANADTSALYTYLYNADVSLAVSGGRGASAAADYAANKTLALPDFRGRVMASFDDMGNSAANRLTTTNMSSAGIGGVGGAETQALLTNHLPAYTPTGTFLSGTLNSGTLNSGTLVSGTLVGGSASVTSNNWVASSSSDSTGVNPGGSGGAGLTSSLTGGLISKIVSNGSVTGTVTGSVTGTVSGTVSGTLSMNAQGGTSAPFRIVQPTIFVTTYIKL